MTQNKNYTLGELADRLNLKLIGDKNSKVNGLGTLRGAGPDQLSFLSNPTYVDQLADCKAAAVILAEKFVGKCPVSALVSDSPYRSFAEASALFAPALSVAAGIHESAVVDPTASVHDTASIGPNAVLGRNVCIGARCVVGAGCTIGDESVLGEDCQLFSNVTLYHGVRCGNRVILHSGSVIGADGFGYASDARGHVKIHQLGGVELGDDVEVGANTTIDRGAIEDTVIEQGVKIDNQVQIGHNCRVGANTIICGCTALAGSATIGRGCILGGGVGITGHIELADGVQVSAMTLINRSISEAGMYSSGTGFMETSDWKRSTVRFQQLDSIARRLKDLESFTDKNQG